MNTWSSFFFLIVHCVLAMVFGMRHIREILNQKDEELAIAHAKIAKMSSELALLRHATDAAGVIKSADSAYVTTDTTSSTTDTALLASAFTKAPPQDTMRRNIRRPEPKSQPQIISKIGLMQGEGPPKRDLKKICWLHVQKTSSWIGDFLFMSRCKNMYDQWMSLTKHQRKHTAYDLVLMGVLKNVQCNVEFCPMKNFGFHNAYNASDMRGHVVSIFRDPLKRMVSAYIFTGMMVPLALTPSSRNKIMHARSMNYSMPIQEYAALPGIPACATKMILGMPCGADPEPPLMQKDLDEAKRRVREDFLFVGLTEEADATEKLFLAMFNGNMKLEQSFATVFHRKNKKTTQEDQLKLEYNLTSTGWKDNFDGGLYDEVKRIFYHRCQQYNVVTSLNI